MSRLPGLVGASVALLLALPSTAVAQVSERSVVFTSDPSRALVIERDAGLLPLIEADGGGGRLGDGLGKDGGGEQARQGEEAAHRSEGGRAKVPGASGPGT